MRRHIRRLAPWFPWPIIGVFAAADMAHLTPPAPVPLALTVVGLAVTYTASAVVSRRLTEAAERAAVTEALTRGYELAAEHCTRHVGRGERLPRAVGETTTLSIPGLRLVQEYGTTYRGTGDPTTAPTPLRSRTPSPRSAQHRR